MKAYMKKLLGTAEERTIKKYKNIVEEINRLELEFEQLSDEQIKAKTSDFKNRLSSGATLDEIKPEAFAVVREASKRVLGMRHYDVQLIGGLVLSEGNIAEMATGEGKTLVATLPSYLKALEGKGVHIITVNEYLANRDKEMMGKIHEFLGLKVGLNVPLMELEAKKIAYQADITYGVGNEFGFDYLRDNMVQSLPQRVQRPYHYAIIDEVDSVLIDEAKTPLIIAGKMQSSQELHYICSMLAKRFKENVDFQFDPETKATNLTDEGINKIEAAFDVNNLYELEHQTLYHYMLQAVRAKVMFERDVDYIVKDGKVMLVDMFTGRIMEGRTLSDGLHQAIEAKEGLSVTEENKSQASITLQNYYRMYPTLAGMTGTAKTEEAEFRQIYGMEVIQVPSNKPKIREDLKDIVFLTAEQKYQAVRDEVKKLHEIGQPVLIGTTSIIQSDRVAQFLDEYKLPYQLLNAKSVEQEATLISLAGQKGQITIATNMAGRGTDIMLGEGVAELGGLKVIGTERHESRRIDNQLKGRSGRQGDPGSTQFFISLEDDMFRRFAREELDKKKKSIKANNEGIVINKDIHEFTDRVQRICEGSNFSMREYNLKLDDVINEQRQIIYQLRNQVLINDDVLSIVQPMITSHFDYILMTHCDEELVPEEWPLAQIQTIINHVLPHHPIDFKDVELNDLGDLKEAIQTRTAAYNLEVEAQKQNRELQYTLKTLMLRVIDAHWVRHLEAMTRLKEGIGLRYYQQEDPMRLYQKEGLEIFTNSYADIEREMSHHLANLMTAAVSDNKNERGHENA